MCTADIGDIMSRSKNSIIGRAKRLGLPGYPVSAQKEGAKKLRDRSKRKIIVRPAPKPLPAPIPIQDLVPLNIGFLKISSDQCRYVTGKGRDGFATYCGHESRGSWCPTHRKVVAA